MVKDDTNYHPKKRMTDADDSATTTFFVERTVHQRVLLKNMRQQVIGNDQCNKPK